MPKTEKNIPDNKECGRIKKILLVLLGILSLVGICVSTHLLMIKTKNEKEEAC